MLLCAFGRGAAVDPGSLEALLEYLRTHEPPVPVAGVALGPIHKRDVVAASAMLEHKKECVCPPPLALVFLGARAVRCTPPPRRRHLLVPPKPPLPSRSGGIECRPVRFAFALPRPPLPPTHPPTHPRAPPPTPRYATILAFDVKVTPDARAAADEAGVRIFTADIIYHLTDQFDKYLKDSVRELQVCAWSCPVMPGTTLSVCACVCVCDLCFGLGAVPWPWPGCGFPMARLRRASAATSYAPRVVLPLT